MDVETLTRQIVYGSRTEGFQIRENSEEEDWKQIQEKCTILGDWGVRVLRRGLDRIAKSVILESRYICRDHRNLFSNYYSKRFIVGSPYCDRLHFFSEPDVTPEDLWFAQRDYLDSYLGYSVVRPIQERCLGRTVIDPYKIKNNIADDFYCLSVPFTSQIGGTALGVNGYPWMSQDGEAMVCAHASLWGACRYLSQRYRSYAEVYPYDLIQMTPECAGRRAPYRGMTYDDYSAILTKFGVYPLIMRVLGDDELKDLYTYVESGFPVLASLGGHVVTLIGHTLDFEKNVHADANGIVSSHQFLKQYIVMDDNYFPYALLGEKNDPANYHTTKNIGSIVTAVCPLPEKAFIPADKARLKGDMCIKKALPLLRQKKHLGPYVTRLFLTSCRPFKQMKHKEALRTLENYPMENIKMAYFITGLSLPHFLWVMEISTLDQYKNGKCVGEVVIDATVGRLSDGMIYLRVGNNLTLNLDDKSYNYSFEGASEEFEQYTHNLGERKY